MGKLQPTIALRDAIGREIEVSVADEAPWLHNLSVMGERWLLNYWPHLYQVAGYLPVNDHTRVALAGDMNTATEIWRSLNPLRSVLAKWIPNHRSVGAHGDRRAEILDGMHRDGGRSGTRSLRGDDGGSQGRVRADLEATGLPARAHAAAAQRRAA